MSFFDSFKKTFGITDTTTQQSKGHRLGTREETSTDSKKDLTTQNQENPPIFTIEFSEKVLGMNLEEVNGKILVSVVAPNSPASVSGIIPGDQIIELNGNHVSSYETFLEFSKSIGRPISLTFFRSNLPFSLPSPSSSESSSSQSLSLSEKDREIRRVAMLKAAQDRTIDPWTSKKGKKTREQPSATPSLHQPCDNLDTLISVQKAKEGETKLSETLGYSPFTPYMTFSGATPSIQAPPPPPSPPPPHSPHSPHPSPPQSGPLRSDVSGSGGGEGSHYEELGLWEDGENKVDQAFSILFSSEEASSPSARTALSTVLKMCSNLQQNKENKFRLVRFLNAAFQSKVAAVSGGLDLMLAAGFTLQALRPSELSAMGVATGSDATGAEDSVQYLVHPLDSLSEARLNYTISRIQELLIGLEIK